MSIDIDVILNDVSRDNNILWNFDAVTSGKSDCMFDVTA